MSICAFDHPYLGGLLGDEETARLFSGEAETGALVALETALAGAEAAAGLISAEHAERIAEGCSDFRPEVDGLRTGTARDGVVVPELVRQLRRAIGGEAAQHAHFGATSQDVIDTALMLRLKGICALFRGRLDQLDAALRRTDESFGCRPLMAHTRMQPAIRITVGDRLRAWAEPLRHHGRSLARLQDNGLALQLGGAAGTLEKLGEKGAAVRAAVAAELGLVDKPQWQSQRDLIVEFGSLLSLISGALGKFGQDVALLAQGGIEIELAGGGGSSAMPHKQNPVAAEVLVSLARFNAAQVAGLHQSLVHEQERSGGAWTLEWMILPQMIAATGAALRLALDLTGAIISLGAAEN